MNRVIQGDCRDVMRELIAQGVHVQCVVTSPPYWGLRDYGTAQWECGDDNCKHCVPATGSTQNKGNNNREGKPFGGVCGVCGAVRIDRQLGLDPTYQEYIANMVEVFGLVHELLADDGTLWLNLGDSYAGSGKDGNPEEGKQATAREAAVTNVRRNVVGLAAKQLCGIPWRVAFALQDAGWWLRQDIIWSKPNPMPESVTDRCTKAHEYLFLLAKSGRYYYDQDAIAERALVGDCGSSFTAGKTGAKNLSGVGQGIRVDDGMRNRRSVWNIATQPYPEAHFATFPEALVEPCILAGSRPGDVVFDPFMGSGTVASVAQRFGRKWLGAELNPAYIELIERRTRGTIGMELIVDPSPPKPVQEALL